MPSPYPQIGKAVSQVTAQNSDAWQRPAKWLDMPTVVEGDQIIHMLVHIHDVQGVNLSIKAGNDYTVDWGDGTVENFAHLETAHHTYNYDDISSDLTSNGMKQVVATVTPQAGKDLTLIYFCEKPIGTSGYVYTPIVEIVMAGENISTLLISGAIKPRGLKRFEIVGHIALTAWAGFFQYCYSIEQIVVPDILPLTSVASIFRDCHLLVSAPWLDTSACNSFSLICYRCYSIRHVPTYDTSNGTAFSSTFNQAYSLKNIPPINTSNGTTFSNFMANCYSVIWLPPSIIMGNGAASASAFSNCIALRNQNPHAFSNPTGHSTAFYANNALEIMPAINFAGATALPNTFKNLHSLVSFLAVGISCDVDFTNANMDAEALEVLYGNLEPGNFTVTVKGNPGALTADSSIATAKGITVITA